MLFDKSLSYIFFSASSLIITTLITTSITNMTSSFSTTSSLPKNNRLQALLDMLTYGRNQNPSNNFSGTGSGLRGPGASFQTQVFSPPKSSPFESTLSAPTNDRNKLLITQHPTRGPDNMGSNTQSSPFSEIISLMGQRKTGKKLNTASKNQSPFSMVLNYLLRKRLGISLPSGQKLQSAQSQSGATNSYLKKSTLPNLSNLYKVTPQLSEMGQSSPRFNIFSYLLNQKGPHKSSHKKKNLSSQSTLLNVLHTKVGLNPNLILNSSSLVGKPRPDFNKWSHLIKSTPVRIQPKFEVGNITSPLKSCFPGTE